MRRHVFSRPDALDLDARELIAAAARRAGMSLEEWIAAVIEETQERPAPPRRKAGSDLDSLMARMSPPPRPQLSRDYEALMAAVAAESERQAQDQASRTAVALESMASWIEQAETRLNDAARSSVDQQDRIAAVLSQALSSLKERLDTVERRVASERTAPPRIDFPMQEALKALAPVSETLVGLRADMARLASHLEQTDSRWAPAADDLRTEIDGLRSGIESLATRAEIAALDAALGSIAKDLEGGPTTKDLRTLASSITVLYEKIQSLSGEVSEGLHRRIGHEIDHLKTKIDAMAETGIDRSVIDFLSSQIVDMRQDLAHRPEPAPADLTPISAQLALLTERMASLSESRAEGGERLSGSIERLSSRIEAVAGREAPSHEPLMQRFDRIEQELRDLGRQADTSGMTQMLRSIDEKLERTPPQPTGFDVLERQIVALAERIEQIPGEALRKALSDIRASLPESSDLDALKHGLVELKALHARSNKKSHETLRAVHDALEALATRLPDQSSASAVETSKVGSLQPADRLEAAVRRLHAATLSQFEDAAPPTFEAASSGIPQTQVADIDERAGSAAFLAASEAERGHLRANFIAAARRAAKGATTEPETDLALETGPPEEAPRPEASSLLERLRRTFESHRRPFLFGLAFLILAAGTAQILPGEDSLSSPPTEVQKTAEAPEATAFEDVSVPALADLSLFQASSLATQAPVAAPSASGQFLVDPATIGELPTGVPGALRQAALSGDAAALYDIAARTAEGRGMARDMAVAVRLFERVSQAGFPPAQERLAAIYEKGTGLQRDLKQAAFWYERAALGGNIRAMHNLATLLASGATGKPDYAAALRWYAEAAEAGFRDSQFNLGLLLAHGVGGKPDPSKAFHWFSLAASHDDAEAAGKREEMAGRLSAAELKAAKSAVALWRPRPVDPVANPMPAMSQGRTAALDRTPGTRS